ncbi:CPBP family intramembrane glutamic endopeptidase [Anaerostipes sp.]|uniref:CPBP family intramembrane glutamic endopeptidase n=1 Tax=Anaerostipes sp. TaxID=1872530 RepID=UPI0025B80FB3|nr:CPBP family intramembrane glutamic endopeptidase [Anaerostipes sp.]MBS7006963.1 CPBP family intramembrane metalloprotease [Anaerostipes sp.]
MNENVKQFLVYYLFYVLCGQACSLCGVSGLYPNAVSGICLFLFSRSILKGQKRQPLQITGTLILFTFAFFLVTQYLFFYLNRLFYGRVLILPQPAEQSPLWVKIAVAGVISPAAEEILFRRFLYQGLKPMGRNKAVLSSSIIFGLCHGKLVQSIYSALWGMVFCFLYEKYQNLKVSMLVHMISNLLSLTAIFRMCLSNPYVSVCFILISVCIVCLTVRTKGECL